MAAQGALNTGCKSQRTREGRAEGPYAHTLSSAWRLGVRQHRQPPGLARPGAMTAAAAPWQSGPFTAAALPSTSASAGTAALISNSCFRHRLGACGPVSTRRAAFVSCAAYGRGSGSGSGSGSGGSDPNYYELLGLDTDCDEEDIRAAFRRRAKELHPDVNKEEGATEAFVQLSRAYEVLSDEESRRQYDITNRTRRLNFFRDIVEDAEEDSPFSWSRVGRRPGGGGGMRPERHDHGRVGKEEEEEEEEDDDDDDGNEGAGEGEEGPGWQRRRSQEELLEELAKFMSGPGSLRAWQSGRLDPWGTSTSDTWFRQVERQTRSPYGPSRQGYGSSRDDDDDGGFGAGGSEWDPSRRVPGWNPPGRGSEWSHPRRQWDDEDRRGGGPGRQGGGGGDFRRPFKI